MRLRIPRGPVAIQVATHVLTLVLAASVWTWGQARLLRGIHETTDARFVAGRLRQRLLEARLSAQAFLARDVQDPRFFLGLPLPATEEFSHALSEAGDRLITLERLRPEDRAATDRLRAQVDQYQGAFLKMTELHRRQGNLEWGLRGEWEKAAREAETTIAGRADLAAPLVELRQMEKDYLLRRDPQIADTWSQQLLALKETARVLGPAAAGRLRGVLDRYRTAFAEFASTDRQLGVGIAGAGTETGLRGEMAKAAQEMDSIVRALHDDAVRRAAASRRRFWTMSLLLLAAGLLLGGLAEYAIARLFLKPPEWLVAAATAPVVEPAAVVAPADGAARAATDDGVNAVLAGLTDAVSVKDLTGRYVLVNDACAKQMGRTVAEIVGRDNRELLSPEAAEVADANERAILDSGTTLTYEVAHGEHTFLTTKGVVRDAGGGIRGLFGISRDITERKRTRDALRAVQEIRTPMNALLGTAQILLDDTGLTAEPRTHALAVRDSAEALLAAFDELLELSRLETGPAALREEELTIVDVVGGAVGTLVPRAQEKSVALAFRVDPAVPETMRGDAARLRQVLVSLLGNAVRFTERGFVHVSADAFDLGRGLRVLRCVVASDAGIVVPADLRARLFEPGTGLGLAIASRLAVLMGGRIDVEDAPGGGSVFTFTARLRVVETTTRAAQPSGQIS